MCTRRISLKLCFNESQPVVSLEIHIQHQKEIFKLGLTWSFILGAGHCEDSLIILMMA